MSNSGRYGQVEFNYDIEEAETTQPESKSSEECAKTEDDEPFIPPPFLTIPSGMAVVSVHSQFFYLFNFCSLIVQLDL